MSIQWVPKKVINKSRVDELLLRTVSTNQFTNYGPNTQHLEGLIREKLGVEDSKAVVCVSNGTAALHALVAAICMKKDCQLTWSTQSFTFPSSAQGYLQDVNIVDIDKDGGIDLEQVQTDGIIVTNVLGNIVDIDKYTQWCEQHGKIVIFDNAATPYTFYKGINSINYGTGSTISFHHTKPVGFGEGGAVIVDIEYEFDLRRCINFGIDNEISTPWHKAASNYKLSDLSSIYIIQHLERLESIVEHHKKLYKYFITNLPDAVTIFPNFSNTVPFVACFCILSPNFTINTIQKLREHNVYSRKYYTPLINSSQAMQVYNNILCIPCTIDMTTTDIDYIFSLLFD